MKIWHPYTQHGIFSQEEMISIDYAKDCYLYYTEKENVQKKIIDAISSWWVITHGHNHPKIRRAVQEAAQNMDQIIFSGISHRYAQLLCDYLTNVLPKHLQYLFFSDSGSVAVEVAIKLAIGYWYHHGYQEQRDRLLVLQNSYHGDTYGAMSVGERGVFTLPYHKQLFSVEALPIDGSKQSEAKALEILSAKLRHNRDRYAACIFEPLVLGAGGMIMISPNFVRELTKLCQQADVLLIADEIMTGWGRTGKIFALDHCQSKSSQPITPDIVCYAKGLTGGFLPLAVTATTQKIYECFLAKDRKKTFFHSSSFTANPLACAAAAANLEIWHKQSDKILKCVDQIAKTHKKNQYRFKEHALLTNTRQCGTILACDVLDSQSSGYLSHVGIDLYKFFMANGALIRPLGNTIYIMPPYCITDAELEFLYNLIIAGVDSLDKASIS